MKPFKKRIVLFSAIIILLLLSTVIGTVAVQAEDESESPKVRHDGVQVITSGKVSLKFYY